MSIIKQIRDKWLQTRVSKEEKRLYSLLSKKREKDLSVIVRELLNKEVKKEKVA